MIAFEMGELSGIIFNILCSFLPDSGNARQDNFAADTRSTLKI
jgi:hypothetical protein